MRVVVVRAGTLRFGELNSVEGIFNRKVYFFGEGSFWVALAEVVVVLLV